LASFLGLRSWILITFLGFFFLSLISTCPLLNYYDAFPFGAIATLTAL
jgi:hypothetical protein